MLYLWEYKQSSEIYGTVLDTLARTIKSISHHDTQVFHWKEGPMADHAMNGLTGDAAHSVGMKCPAVHPRQLLHRGWRRIPSHCYMLYITYFILLGYFTNYKFRLSASKWIYPEAFYVKSDGRKSVPQKHSSPSSTPPPTGLSSP